MLVGSVRALVEEHVREGRTLEFKQELPGGSDDAKREFLADASSFANAGAADLIYRIRDEDGVARPSIAELSQQRRGDAPAGGADRRRRVEDDPAGERAGGRGPAQHEPVACSRRDGLAESEPDHPAPVRELR